jgi:polyhydroxyalkanoate synthesis regulator phasin
MDVEKIQKINALALNLMKQGLAKDREDAMLQAERAYQGQDAVRFNEMVREVKDNTDRQSGLVSTVPRETSNELAPEKVKEILEKNTQFLVKTIQEFQTKITALESQVSDLKSKVLMSRTSTPTSSNISVSSTSEAPKPQQIPNNVPRGNSGSEQLKPRYGNYTDQDVSIEKFFYMGSK